MTDVRQHSHDDDGGGDEGTAAAAAAAAAADAAEGTRGTEEDVGGEVREGGGDNDDEDEDDDDSALVDAARATPGGVDIRDRTWLARTYRCCFVGRDLVSWLVESGAAATREAAVARGTRWLDAGLFSHVTRDHTFRDAKLFYRFVEDEDEPPQDLQARWSSFLQPLAAAADAAAGLQPSIGLDAAEDAGFAPLAGQPGSSGSLGLAPLDEANLLMLDHVHPPAWREPVPPPSATYNLVVIGGGPAGLVSAMGGAGLGARVALIEREYIGGDCLVFGCVPSKALLAAANAAHRVRRELPRGISIAGEVRVDFAEVMRGLREKRAAIAAHDSAALLARSGVDVFLGPARFEGRDAVSVNGKRLRFARACIATGARPAVPDIPGLKDAGFLTSETVFNLTELPRRLVVIGGGPIGCELAQGFCRLGADVALVSRADVLLPREDPDAAALVAAQLAADGVRVVLGAKVLRVSSSSPPPPPQEQEQEQEQEQPGARENVAVVVDVQGREVELACDAILVAVGRVPNVEGLNLEAAGVGYDGRDGVVVNDALQTSNAAVYAAGDVATRFKFTHQADQMARIVLRNALFGGFGRKASVSALVLPWCTYTQPEIAHVGLYPRDLAARRIPHRTLTKDFADIDRSICDSPAGRPPPGFVRLHVREGSGEIIGATIVHARAGEMISEVTACMVGGVSIQTLGSVVHPYPTETEAIRALGDEFSRARLTPLVRVLLRKLLAFRR